MAVWVDKVVGWRRAALVQGVGMDQWWAATGCAGTWHETAEL